MEIDDTILVYLLTSRNSWVDHTVLTGEKLHLCELCDRVFDTRHGLRVHKRVHQRSLACLHCGKKFLRKYYLKRHMVKYHADHKIFGCQICDGGPVAQNSNKKSEKTFRCTVCNKQFASEMNLIAHSKVHGSQKAIKCPLCVKTYPDKDDFFQHLNSHKVNKAGARENIISCEVCNKSFASECDLTDHYKVHGKLQCPFCEETFQGTNYLFEHVLSHQDKNKMFKCKHCGKRFKDGNAVKSHSRSKHSHFTCSYCGITFNDESKWKMHERAHKRAHKILSCVDCQEKFATQEDLSSHSEKFHGGKRFSCTVCKRGFSKKKKLNKHLQNPCSSLFSQGSSIINEK